MAKPPISIPKPTAEELEEGEDAIAEAAAVATGLDLSDRQTMNRLNKLLRRDEMDGHLHRILVGGVYFVAICAAVMFGSLAWGMAFPAFSFLTPDQVTALQGFLFSGGVGAAFTVAARKVAGSDGD